MLRARVVTFLADLLGDVITEAYESETERRDKARVCAFCGEASCLDHCVYCGASNVENEACRPNCPHETGVFPVEEPGMRCYRCKSPLDTTYHEVMTDVGIGVQGPTMWVDVCCAQCALEASQ